MADAPHYYVNSPVSGTEYFAPMGYGCIPNNGSSITVHVKAWTGANGTGSLVTVTTLLADVWDTTTSASKNTFSGNFNTVTATYSAPNGTDWYKPAGKFTGAQSVGSLELWISYTGTAFVPSVPTFSPSNGNIGDTITLTGTHFTDATSVLFNGTSASFSVTNDTAISATVPAGATSGPITVGNPSGSAASAGNFVVNSAGTVNVYAYDGSTWQTMSGDFAYDGTTQQSMSVYAYDGSAWQQIA